MTIKCISWNIWALKIEMNSQKYGVSNDVLYLLIAFNIKGYCVKLIISRMLLWLRISHQCKGRYDIHDLYCILFLIVNGSIQITIYASLYTTVSKWYGFSSQYLYTQHFSLTEYSNLCCNFKIHGDSSTRCPWEHSLHILSDKNQFSKYHRREKLNFNVKELLMNHIINILHENNHKFQSFVDI